MSEPTQPLPFAVKAAEEIRQTGFARSGYIHFVPNWDTDEAALIISHHFAETKEALELARKALPIAGSWLRQFYKVDNRKCQEMKEAIDKVYEALAALDKVLPKKEAIKETEGKA